LNETLDIIGKIKDPIKGNIIFMMNHLGRYWCAINKLGLRQSDKVVDFGCGRGYGTYLLNLYCCAIGVDINIEYLEDARRMFGNLFYDPDVVETIGCLEYYDKAICNEVIEHVPQLMQREIIKRIVSWIKPGGKIFLTFPKGEDKPSKYNPYHICEPSIESMGEMLLENKIEYEYEKHDVFNTFGKFETQIIMWGHK
jgi:2-polyprenyl-3-methyl-5-hydroxy-6-metoxy-1,4-benzoquinol methylase